MNSNSVIPYLISSWLAFDDRIKKMNNTQLLNRDFSPYSWGVKRLFNLSICCLFLSMYGCIEDPPILSQDPFETDGGEPIQELITDQFTSIDQGNAGEDRGDPNLDMTSDQFRIDEGSAGEAMGGVDAEIPPEDALVGGDDPDIGDWPALDLPEPIPQEEICDGEDNDLDALIDEGVSNPCGGCLPWDERVGCVGWRAQLIETQVLDSDHNSSAGALDSARLLSLNAAVTTYERFEIEGAECVRYGSPQAWSPTRSVGTVTLDTSLVSLSLVPNPQQLGRYQVLGEEGSFVIHEPDDLIEISWEGETQNEIDFEGGSLELLSPPFVTLATERELDRIADQLISDDQTLDAELSLRWVAHPRGDQAGPPLTFYIGGSQSLFQRDAYRAIKHYQLVGTLFDDGRLDFILPRTLRAPGSSVWVYLERTQTANIVLERVHPMSARAGHRIEARGRSEVDPASIPALLTLTEPSPVGPDPEVSAEGLRVAWRLDDPTKPPIQLLLSLILYDQSRSEQLTCEILDPSVGRLVIPAERLTYWPTGPQSLRQLTLSANEESLSLTFPDRGQLRAAVSHILRLSDL